MGSTFQSRANGLCHMTTHTTRSVRCEGLSLLKIEGKLWPNPKKRGNTLGFFFDVGPFGVGKHIQSILPEMWDGNAHTLVS